MTDAEALEKVRKLIAMTASDFEEEARTAAMQACRLIRTHGFTVGPTETGPRFDPFSYRPSPPAPVPPRGPFQPTPFVPIHIYARAPGTCRACNKQFGSGASILMVKGRGATHFECGDYWKRWG
jgi:hypothetical protein